MAVDVSFVEYFVPILTFLLVMVIVSAVLIKTKLLGDSKWLTVLIAIVIASLFISFGGSSEIVSVIAPWFAVLLVSLVFIFVIVAFVGSKSLEGFKTGIGLIFILILLIIFVVTAFVVYSSYISPYLPGGSGGGDLGRFTDWLYSSRVVGGILLVAVAALAAWVLVKAK